MIQDILGRVQRLLLSPATEWEAIGGEPANMGDIYKNYVLPLIAFAAICVTIGVLWFGLIALALRMFVVIVLSWLIGVYLFSLIIDALAPTFGGQKNSRPGVQSRSLRAHRCLGGEYLQHYFSSKHSIVYRQHLFALSPLCWAAQIDELPGGQSVGLYGRSLHLWHRCHDHSGLFAGDVWDQLLHVLSICFGLCVF